MNTIYFNNYNSFQDLNLILSSKTIGAAGVKTQIIDIPGADGSLDLTDYFGKINYKNRNIKFTFSIIGKSENQIAQYSQIKNLLHGQKMKIRLSDDPNYYYIGRLLVEDWQNNKNVAEITITADCEPFKYKVNKTIVVNSVINNAILIYLNEGKPVIPTITLTNSATITFKNNTYNVEAGTFQIDNLIFDEGANLLNVTGNTMITLEYQEGKL